MKKRFLTLLVTLMMVLGMVPSFQTAVFAKYNPFEGVSNEEEVEVNTSFNVLQNVTAKSEDGKEYLIEVVNVLKVNEPSSWWNDADRPEEITPTVVGDTYRVLYMARTNDEEKKEVGGFTKVYKVIKGHTQNLRVSFQPEATTADGVDTGNVGVMVLSVTLSDPNPDAYAVIRIKLPDVPNLTLTNFDENGKYIMSTGETMYLKTDGSGKRYLEFTIKGSGGTQNESINFKLPNGVTPNNTKIDFSDKSFELVESKFSGKPLFEASGFSFESEFGWQNITMNRAPSSLIGITGTKVLGGNPSWTVTGLNKYNSGDKGVIFTSDYTLTSKITLPDGLSFKEGTGALSADGYSYSVDGVIIANFTKPVQSVEIVGQEMHVVYKEVNDTLTANGDDKDGKAADLNNLSFGITLVGNQIKVDTAKITGNVYIPDEATFVANSCKDNLKNTSTAKAEVGVKMPGSNVSIYKYSSLGNGGAFTDPTTTVITYTLTAINDGSKDVSDVVVSDEVAENAEIILEGPNAPTTGFHYDAETRTISWNVGGMSADANEPTRSQTFKFSIKPKADIRDGDKIYNTAKVFYDKKDTSYSTQVYNTYRKPSAALSVVKYNATALNEAYQYGDTTRAQTGYSFDLGDRIEWRVTVRNTGLGPSDAIYISDTIPSYLDIDAEALKAKYPAYNITVDGQKVIIHIPSVPASTSMNFYIPTTVASASSTGSKISNYAFIYKESGGSYLDYDYHYYYYKHLEEKVSLEKIRTSGKTTYYIEPTEKNEFTSNYVKWQLKVVNEGNIASQPKTITDYVPDGLKITDEQLAELKKTYGDANVTYEVNVNDEKADLLTIKNVVVPAASTILINVATVVEPKYEHDVQHNDKNHTISDEFKNKDIMINAAYITGDENPHEAQVEYLLPAPKDIVVNKSVPFNNGEDGKQNPRKLENVKYNDVFYAHYEIDYIINVVNNGETSTSYLEDKMELIDNMRNGLRPLGAGFEKTSGTITGTIVSEGADNGKPITGTWSIVTTEKGEEVYVINWTGNGVDNVPDLEPKESWGVTYTAEYYVPIKDNGEYDHDGEIYLNNTASIYIGGELIVSGSATVGGSVANGYVRPEARLSKIITKINDTELKEDQDHSQSLLYPGDYIEYEVSAKNTMVAEWTDKDGHVHATNGTPLVVKIKDSLPVIAKDSTFAWELGTNVKVVYEDGYTGPKAVMTLETNEDGTKQYVLTWENVSIAIQKTVKYTVQLEYPTADEFTNAFGQFTSVVTNKASLTCNDYYLELKDQADHTLTKNLMTLWKKVNGKNDTVDNNGDFVEAAVTLDAASDNEADRTAVWTLGGFGTEHYSAGVIVTDELTKVKSKFDVTEIDFGKYEIVRKRNVAEEDCHYTIELRNGTGAILGTFDVKDGEKFVLPESVKLDDIVAISWQFGDVMSLKIKETPKITGIAKTTAYGIVPNDMHLLYNAEPDQKAQVNVRLLNSVALNKGVYHTDGVTPVTNESDIDKAKVGEDVTFQIQFKNISGKEIDLSKCTFTDSINQLSLDTTQPLQIEVKHVSADSSAVETVALLESSTIPADEWKNGVFEIKFAQGILDVDDTLIITYKAKVTENFYKSVDTTLNESIRDTYALHNKITLVTDDEEEVYAETDYYYAIMKAYAYLQKSIVGVGFTNSASSSSSVYQATMFEKLGFGDSLAQLTGVPSFNLGNAYFGSHTDQEIVIFYNLTLVNSGESTCAVTFKDLVDEKDFEGQVVGIYDDTMNTYVSSYEQYYDSSTTQKNISTYKTTGSHYLKDAINFNDGTGTAQITEDGEVKSEYITDSASSKLTLSSTTSNTNTGSGSVKLYPGHVANVVIAVKISGDNFKQQTLTNSATMTVESEQVKKLGPSSWEPKEMKASLPTIKNSSVELESNNGDFSANDDKLSSSVSIEAPKYEVGINKSVAGFISADDWNGYETSLDANMISIESKTPLVKDYIVWQLDIRNMNSFYMSGFTVTDFVPYPYEIAAVYIKNSEDTGYQLRWTPVNTVNGIKMTTPDWDADNKPLANTPFQEISFECDGNAFSNTAEKPAYSRVNNTIAPGKVLSFYIVTRPSDTWAHDGASMITYKNNSQVVVDNENVIVSGVSNGQPYNNEEGELRGASDYATVKIGGAYSAVSYKTVDNNKDADEHEFGVSNTSKDYVVVNSDGTFTYGLNFKSGADYQFTNISMIDRLPVVNDRGVVNVDADRSSEFRVRFGENSNFKITKKLKDGTTSTLVERDLENPEAEWDYYVQYNTQGPTDKFTAPNSSDWVDDGEGNWTDTYDENTTTFRIIYNEAFVVEPGAGLLINFDGVVDHPESVKVDQIAWNSFGYVYYVDISGNNMPVLQQAEPPKVGVKIIGAKIQLKKVDEDNIGLGGAEFGIYDDSSCTSDHLIQTITSDATGMATSKNLLLKKYYVKEIKAPVMYTACDTVYEVDLTDSKLNAIVPLITNDDGTLKGIPNEINPVTLHLKKTMDTQNHLADEAGTVTINVTGKFIQADGTIGKEDETKTVTFSEEERINGTIKDIELLVAGFEYKIEEIGIDVDHQYEPKFLVAGLENALTYEYDENGIISNWPSEDLRDYSKDDMYAPTHKNEYMTVVNMEPAPDLTITKRIVGDYSLNETFTVRVTGVFKDTYNPELADQGITTKEFTIGPTSTFTDVTIDDNTYGQGSITVDNLLYGFTYKVVEVGNDNYTTKYFTAKQSSFEDEITEDDYKEVKNVVLELRSAPQEVIVQNTRKEAGKITITKKASGFTAGNSADLEDQFTIDLTGVFSGSHEVQTKSYPIKINESITIDGLVYGETYVVKENMTAEQQAMYQAFYDGAKFTVTDENGNTEDAGKEVTIKDKNQTVKVENKYYAKVDYVFEALKTVVGTDISAIEGQLKFVVNEVVNKKEVQVAVGTNDETGKVVFSPITFYHNFNGKYNGKTTDTDIGTHTFIIREVNTNGDFIYDKTYYKVQMKISDNGDGTLAYTNPVLTYINNKAVSGKPEFMGSTEKENNGAQFTNTIASHVTIHKYDTTSRQSIKGAKFTLYKDTVSSKNKVSTKTTDNKGNVTFNQLMPGHYVITESAVPTGYYRLEEPIEFDIQLNDEGLLEVVYDEAVTTNEILLNYVLINEDNSLEVGNDRNPETWVETGVKSDQLQSLYLVVASLLGMIAIVLKKKKDLNKNTK